MLPKLVRDKVIDEIKESGRNPKFYYADEEHFQKFLLRKLKEETDEFLDEESLDELADIADVMDAILEMKGISKSEFEAIRKDKQEIKGGFSKRVILED